MQQMFFLTNLTEEQLDDGSSRLALILSLDRVNNWKILAEDDQTGMKIIHAIFHNERDGDGDSPKTKRLELHPAYLGRSYKDIAQLAKQGNSPQSRIVKQVIFTAWEVDGEFHQGTFAEWEAAGKPPRLKGWSVANEFLGHPIDIPDDSDLDF
jgi:hypothetical protein